MAHGNRISRLKGLNLNLNQPPNEIRHERTSKLPSKLFKDEKEWAAWLDKTGYIAWPLAQDRQKVIGHQVRNLC